MTSPRRLIDPDSKDEYEVRPLIGNATGYIDVRLQPGEAVVRKLPAPDEVDRLVEEWANSWHSDASVGYSDLKSRICALLARQTERQRAAVALADAISCWCHTMNEKADTVTGWVPLSVFNAYLEARRAAREPAREGWAR